VLGLIGPNGAGKTTLFNCISGFARPDHGSIRLDGVDITRRSPERVAASGCNRTFQIVQLVGSLNVIENVMIGLHGQARSTWVQQALRTPGSRREEARLRARARAVLASVGIERLADQPVGPLPFGLKRKVELARALAGDITLLLLDEVSSGLTWAEQTELVELIDGQRRQREFAVVLVSHDMGFVGKICDRVVALSAGRMIANGTHEEVQSDPAVIAAYLEAPTGPADQEDGTRAVG
jgi:branched-chain amino acid transport system ATP-binding protein